MAKDVTNWGVASIDEDGTISALGIDSQDGGTFAIGHSSDTISIGGQVTDYIIINAGDAKLKILDLPDADPQELNQIWADSTDGYRLKVSQG